MKRFFDIMPGPTSCSAPSVARRQMLDPIQSILATLTGQAQPESKPTIDPGHTAWFSQAAPLPADDASPGPSPIKPGSEPQRILVIGGSTDNLFKFRGQMLLDFQAAGHTVMTCAGEKDDPTVQWLQDNGISFDLIEQIERRGVNPIKDLQYYRELQRVIARLKPTMVLSYTIKPVIYGTLAAKKVGVPHIGAMITGAGMTFMEGGLAKRLLRWLTSAMLRFSLKHADVLIFQNQDDVALFKQIGVIKKQKVLQTCGSGVDLDYFPPEPTPAGPPVFLLIARMIPEKGVRDFAEASALVREKHPEAHFQIIGPHELMGARITPEEVKHWQDDYGVEYLGFQRDVRPYLKNASVYCLPSYYREGQPRSILEAMAMGRPIITTDSVGCRETVEEGVNGLLVPPKSPKQLADAMLKLIETPGLIEQMGQASLEKARAQYDVHKVNRNIIQALGL